MVTLTVNNVCPLECAHCYLNYDGPGLDCLDNLFQLLARSSFAHLAIVGKEPLANPKAVADCDRFIRLCRAKGITISIITNGIGLDRLTPEMLSEISFVDISMDGGPLTYQRYRHQSFDGLVRKIAKAKKNGLREVNVLHTVFTENAAQVEDMLAVRAYAPIDKILFSPYLETRNDGTNAVTMLAPDDYLASFFGLQHKLDERDYVCLNQYYLNLFEIDKAAIMTKAAEAGFDDHTILLDRNPLALGLIRVTYDGKILSPYASIHPALYGNATMTVSSATERGWTLNQAFEELRRCEVPPG